MSSIPGLERREWNKDHAEDSVEGNVWENPHVQKDTNAIEVYFAIGLPLYHGLGREVTLRNLQKWLFFIHIAVAEIYVHA
jgi:hypothetical protein